ncbi:uncharacterized protein LOC120342643 isoform X2 [Styela clava]
MQNQDPAGGGDVKVDRFHLQQQLQQYQLDKDKMRNRGMEYSPRFRSGNDLRMTGSGDNSAMTPTYPLHSRVSGKEKRRRVHAWLGAQVGSETDATGNNASPNNISATTTDIPSLPIPELPSFAALPNENCTAGVSADRTESKDGSDLLHSKSEFVPGTNVPVLPYSKYSDMTPALRRSERAEARLIGKPDHSNVLDTGISHKYSDSPHTGAQNFVRKSDTGKHKTPNMEFVGGGDNYCYVYDPLIAKAYTKKYPISPSINTPPPASVQDLQHSTVPPKYYPSSENFTPAPAVHLLGTPYSPNLPNGSNFAKNGFSKYSQQNSGLSRQEQIPPHTFSQFDPSLFPLPTKYEEYDMRPIKPLNVEVKKSYYGASAAKDEAITFSNTKSQPKPYLRRSHSTNVSYPVPKSRSKEKHGISSSSKPLSRVQSNVEGKRRVALMKASPRPSPLSPRRRRQQQSSSEKKRNAKLKAVNKSQDTATSEEEKVEINEEISATPVPDDKHVSELPVDLKHVKAATKIQAVWKGYRTRKLDPKVVEIRQEVRARRAEQYISVLCHEVQCLKENLDAEKKMRDLQTEAIRYIWSQLRSLQKGHRAGHDKVGEGRHRKRSPDNRRPRSKSNSPRRVKNKASKNGTPLCSPLDTPKRSSVKTKTSHRTSDFSEHDFGDESDSVESIEDQNQTQKRADVSWKEVPDEDLFKDRSSTQNIEINKKPPRQHAADDTDEGRGTLVTDGEGNPAHSSPEDNDLPDKSPSNGKMKVVAENLQLKTTIDVLQDQVAQLQEAMLTLSDRILNRSRSDVNLDVWEETDELKLISESQAITTSTSPPQKLVVEQEPEINMDPEPILSARGEVPRFSLKDSLTTLKSALSEDELWALCEQAGHNIKNKSLKKYLSLETTFIRQDGRIEFSDFNVAKNQIDEMYLAPEVLEHKSASSTKSSVFSLSVVLWSAADWEMSAEQAPQLSQELESLLVVMSQDDVAQRAEIDDVIKICEDHHAKAGVNSLCVCSSLFAEVQDALTFAKTGKINHKKIAQELSKEQQLLTKKLFKDRVLPDINNITWRSALKPASDRVLSPRRHSDPTPHDQLMNSLSSSRIPLRKSPRPKIFTVRDMFLKDPELVQKLNILPGQRRKNQKAMRLVMRRQSPKDSSSPPMPGIPTAPRALRAGVSESSYTSTNQLSSVILRWHPAKVFDKHGQEAKSDKIIGYRIYVNGHPKGMVAGTKSRALLEGLRQSTEYRVHVRAVSSLGESDPSNVVIAHITSSPLKQKNEWTEDDEKMQDDFDIDKGDAPEKTDKCFPTAPPRTTAPQAKPRLGAVFPKLSDHVKNPEISESVGDSDKRHKKSESPVSSSSVESSKSDSKKDDDVIDRVLRRYGIQQTATIVPGYSSGSTLSPMPVDYRPKSRVSTDSNRRSVQTSLLDDLTKSLETSSISSKASTTSESAADNDSIRHNAGSEVTPKSLALLAQLKSDLLQ